MTGHYATVWSDSPLTTHELVTTNKLPYTFCNFTGICKLSAWSIDLIGVRGFKFTTIKSLPIGKVDDSRHYFIMSCQNCPANWNAAHIIHGIQGGFKLGVGVTLSKGQMLLILLNIRREHSSNYQGTISEPSQSIQLFALWLFTVNSKQNYGVTLDRGAVFKNFQFCQC